MHKTEPSRQRSVVNLICWVPDYQEAALWCNLGFQRGTLYSVAVIAVLSVAVIISARFPMLESEIQMGIDLVRKQ